MAHPVQSGKVIERSTATLEALDVSILSRIYTIMTAPYGAFSEIKSSKPLKESVGLLGLTWMLWTLFRFTAGSQQLVAESLGGLALFIIVNVFFVHLMMVLRRGRSDLMTTFCVSCFSLIPVIAGLVIMIGLSVAGARYTILTIFDSAAAFLAVSYYIVLLTAGLSDVHHSLTFTAFVNGGVIPALIYLVLFKLVF